MDNKTLDKAVELSIEIGVLSRCDSNAYIVDHFEDIFHSIDYPRRDLILDIIKQAAYDRLLEAEKKFKEL